MKSRSHQQGIALVITLIMLAVTLVMAVAFLAISTRERGSVTTSTDAAHAREATDAALAHAEAQVMANILATTNPYNFGMLVSTNYINTYGFNHTVGPDPTNVNYDYLSVGGPLSAADLQQNIANLLYLPRAPVFVPTNSTGGYDFRYYLDLNRNRQFDPNNNVSNLVYFSSDNTFSNLGPISEVGDPEWIGVLEHPDQPHGPLNKFIARYAFIAVPVGNTLDVNAIYNDSLASDGGSFPNMKPGFDGFLRNEGVGSWELNLAAFLTDLNTNEWDNNTGGNGYHYQTPLGAAFNTGSAFDDALSILRYRYGYDIHNQTNVTQYARYGMFITNNIDDFSDGPLMTNNNLPFDNDGINIVTRPWAGSDNTNHFFGLSDFFNPAIFRPSGYGILPATRVFPDRLLHAGTNTPVAGNSTVPTYDRYTYYRMLAELGTESTPDYGKMNLNYVNVDDRGNVVPGMETNLLPWHALQFFTNAADRLLRAYTTNWHDANFAFYTNTFGVVTTNAFGITGIPVWVRGQFVYTPAVQRLLQMAANMFDATTNSFYPSVFRPMFFRDPVTGDIFINGYTNIDTVNMATATSDLSNPLSTPVDISALVANTAVQPLNSINVYGVPWIIGAKKGLPSFNELYMLSNVQVTRKLRVNKPPATPTLTTNQQYIVGITNQVGMSFWNSYYSNYVGSGNVTVYMEDTMRMVLTNGLYPSTNSTALIFTNISNLSAWPGSYWTGGTPPPVNRVNPASFVSVIFTNGFLPDSVYQWQTGGFINVADNPAWETNIYQNYVLPQFGLMTTNWAQAYVLDGPSGAQHVVDYVQFSGPNTNRNINAELKDPNYPDPTAAYYQWSTNAFGKNNSSAVPSYGEVNQISISRGFLGATAPQGGVWAQITTPTGGNSIAEQQAFFNGFWNASGLYQYNGVTYTNILVSDQAPYTPTRSAYDFTLWQANDPLVHYLASDLTYNYPGQIGLNRSDVVPPVFNIPSLNLTQVGNRYQPWGLSAQMVGVAGVDTNQYNLSYKDPLVWGSDYWDFPTNMYPSVGWLGRVHRGTPWQTIYLKATDIVPATNRFGLNNGILTWQTWAGNTANRFDATNGAPVTDRLLFDLFTTGPNENATLGELSVNQTDLAAWSALFGGLPVLTNYAGTNMTIFQPAGPNATNAYLGYIWNSIQQARENTNLFPKQVFGHVGDVLSAPWLTVQSPFLAGNDPNLGVSDQMYEWLPQQVMSLLKVGTPRYVIYCYGQALKPAPNGIVTSGANALMCTNYQIVSESAVRAVVQVENPNGNTPHVVLKNLNPLPPD